MCSLLLPKVLVTRALSLLIRVHVMLHNQDADKDASIRWEIGPAGLFITLTARVPHFWGRCSC